MKSRVFVPDDSGMLFAKKWNAGRSQVSRESAGAGRGAMKHVRMFCTLGHIARSMTFIHSPPTHDWTPYQILDVSSQLHCIPGI